jgi:SAM-dependent methyltransferase
MARIDRGKRALGGAIKRTSPSRAATILVERRLALGRVLDFGCGYGLDAATFGWEAYDPYYRPIELAGPYDTIVCTLVLNALSRNNRAKALARIRDLLAGDGRAYLAVARDLPRMGKLGMHHSVQNYVVLTLPSIYADERLEIYELTSDVSFEDKTHDFLSRRDRRRMR